MLCKEESNIFFIGVQHLYLKSIIYTDCYRLNQVNLQMSCSVKFPYNYQQYQSDSKIIFKFYDNITVSECLDLESDRI